VLQQTPEHDVGGGPAAEQRREPGQLREGEEHVVAGDPCLHGEPARQSCAQAALAQAATPKVGHPAAGQLSDGRPQRSLHGSADPRAAGLVRLQPRGLLLRPGKRRQGLREQPLQALPVRAGGRPHRLPGGGRPQPRSSVQAFAQAHALLTQRPYDGRRSLAARGAPGLVKAASQARDVLRSAVGQMLLGGPLPKPRR